MRTIRSDLATIVSSLLLIYCSMNCHHSVSHPHIYLSPVFYIFFTPLSIKHRFIGLGYYEQRIMTIVLIVIYPFKAELSFILNLVCIGLNSDLYWSIFGDPLSNRTSCHPQMTASKNIEGLSIVMLHTLGNLEYLGKAHWTDLLEMKLILLVWQCRSRKWWLLSKLQHSWAHKYSSANDCALLSRS